MKMMIQKISKKAYEEHLNEVGKSLGDDEFIIGGVMRRNRNKYGELIRKHDPIGFNVGYNDWKREKQGHL
jgi:hypothetical protein